MTIEGSTLTNLGKVPNSALSNDSISITSNAGTITVSESSVMLGGSVNLEMAPITFLSTSPASSHAATMSFGTTLSSGTPVQNTLGYDVLVNISVAVTSSTNGSILIGVGSSSTPTMDTVAASFTTLTFLPFSFSAIVPSNYYLCVGTSGTISVSSITAQVCPI